VTEPHQHNQPSIERQTLQADILCVGFGPATGGFLTTVTKGLVKEDGSPAYESRVSPGSPFQVLCYERADDLGYGVSGVVTRGRSLKASFPAEEFNQIPFFSKVTGEKVLYLLDPHGASRKPLLVRMADAFLKLLPGVRKKLSFALPFLPAFLHKKDGYIFSLGQFNQWVGSQVMMSGQVQVWPGTPVAEALIENGRVEGVRLSDQGVDKAGNPAENYLPGMDVKAPLTVVGDGPVGPVGRQLDRLFGMPEGHSTHEWALGMKVVVDLPESTQLKPGFVLHTMGYPEPEIFGFLYVFPGNIASGGIFVPSWFDNPARTGYLYLQHWMRHPALWKHLEGAALRSWGAKSLQESGLRGEPFLVGDGYARIGEGSGSTNVLTNSGVDEAWATGVQLGEAVLELLNKNKPFDRADLEQTYVKRRRESWVFKEGLMGERARDGFQKGFVQGMLGMALAGFSAGALSWPGKPLAPHRRIPTLEEYYKGRISQEEIADIRRQCLALGKPVHETLMRKAGWPEIPLDGKLMVSHQDALLVGGKVQAPPGFPDHVMILKPDACTLCERRVCVDMCSGQALAIAEKGGVSFDREKCVHCGACLWNCVELVESLTGRTNLDFRAGAGGLHSAEN
jgi:electron-transferring-flavoprotein dehydrogenase